MPGTTLPITKRYYPKLSEVVTVDDLPVFLHFAQDGLNSLLGSIHYKKLQYSKSFRGDSVFYSLDIVSKNIRLDLPLGLRLVHSFPIPHHLVRYRTKNNPLNLINYSKSVN